MEVRPPDHFLLHLHLKVAVNNRLMTVFHIILWNNPLVLHPLFNEEVNGIGLLQKGVSDMLFIPQDLLQCFQTPLCFPSPVKMPSTSKPHPIWSRLAPSRYSQ